jgi:hypothetical protein
VHVNRVQLRRGYITEKQARECNLAYELADPTTSILWIRSVKKNTAQTMLQTTTVMVLTFVIYPAFNDTNPSKITVNATVKTPSKPTIWFAISTSLDQTWSLGQTSKKEKKQKHTQKRPPANQRARGHGPPGPAVGRPGQRSSACAC